MLKHLTVRRARLSLLIALLLVAIVSLASLGLRSAAGRGPTLTVTLTPKLYRLSDQGSSHTMIPIAKHAQAVESAEINTWLYLKQTAPADHASGLLAFANQTDNDYIFDVGGKIGLDNGGWLIFGPFTLPAHSLNVYVSAYATLAGEAGELAAGSVNETDMGGYTGLNVMNWAVSLDPQTLDQEESLIQTQLSSGSDVPGQEQEIFTHLHVQEAQKGLWIVPGTGSCTTSAQQTTHSVNKQQATQLTIGFTCTEDTYADVPGPFQNTAFPQSYEPIAEFTAYTTGATTNSSSLIAIPLKVWRAKIDTQHCIQQIMGKSRAVARQILLALPGIADVAFSVDGNIPPDPQAIQVQVLVNTGVQDS